MNSDLTYRLGRAGLASLFLLGSINKILSFAETQQRMGEAGLDPTTLLLLAVIALEAIAAAILIIGHRIAHLAATALAAFTLCTNAVFHRFWEMHGEIADLELSLFFKNVAIAGALLAVAAVERQRSLAKSQIAD